MFLNTTGLLTVIAISALLPTATTAEGKLELTTELINQDYCIGDADLDGVSLKLRLRYRNIGSTPIILHKHSTTVYEVFVRKSPDGEIETSAQLHYVSEGPLKVGEPSLKSFVILKPQDSYLTETIIRVFVTRDETAHFPGAVSAGDHYLQVTIGTGIGSSETEGVLRRKWQAYGLLWTQPVTSKPMKFTIDKNRNVLDCK